MFGRNIKNTLVALLLWGSAILLYACDRPPQVEDTSSDEAMMTEFSEEFSVVVSENGLKSYHFTTPMLEGYTQAKDPYREFRKGVKIVTYKKDSLSSVDATLTANYAIFYINRDLWETKGNVVAKSSEGRTLYTQQLFWNAKTKRIYSNVDSKIVLNDGSDVAYGEGFESDDAMRDWRFRRMTGRMELEMPSTPDSVDRKHRAEPASQGESQPRSRRPTAAPTPSPFGNPNSKIVTPLTSGGGVRPMNDMSGMPNPNKDSEERKQRRR